MQSYKNLSESAIQTAAYFDLIGQPQHAIQTLENAMSSLHGENTDALQAAFLIELAGLIWKMGSYERAELIDFKLAIITCLLFLGEIEQKYGDTELTHKSYRRAAKEAKLVGFINFEGAAKQYIKPSEMSTSKA